MLTGMVLFRMDNDDVVKEGSIPVSLWTYFKLLRDSQKDPEAVLGS